MKRLRRVSQVVDLLNKEHNYYISSSKLKTLYKEGIIPGLRFDNTIYIFYDDVVKILLQRR